MRRELIIAPELLADGRLDALEKMLAALIDGTDAGQGSDLINDDMAAALGASVSKVKQCIAKLMTMGMIAHEMAAGNKRLLRSQLAGYKAERRRALGWDAPAAQAPAAPAPVADHPAPLFRAAVEPAAAVAACPADVPSDEDIYKAYPRKIERKAGLSAIKSARAALAKALRAQGNPNPKQSAGEILLARTVEFAASWADRVARNPNDKQYIPYPQRFYNRGQWDEESTESWRITNAQSARNGRRTSAERGQFPERITAPVEYLGRGGGGVAGGR